MLLTKQEQKTYDLLALKSGKIVSRDEIAQTIWGELWLKKYSDWRIDRLIYTLRQKAGGRFKLKTIRNSGYVLITDGVTIEAEPEIKVAGTLPTKSYLEYMNNPENPRQVYKNLFAAAKPLPNAKKILAVNSYSFDNVDSLKKYYPHSEVYFSNFDSRALKLHEERMRILKLSGFHSVYDDIRQSIFKDSFFDLVINDFRLNFNSNNKQNKEAVSGMYRILKAGGTVLISLVVDPRFESEKYGLNQEKAPVNKDKPWNFVAQEGLTRKCFTVPYYKKLFADTGFKNIEEFDIDNGKSWTPPFRRFKLTK
jgi:DNA-binding winged helix-turn-helix (wHTH) protein